MPPTPAWYLDSGSAVNAEGNQLMLNVRLESSSAFGVSDKVSVLDTNAASDLAKIGAISGWRFNSNTGALDAAGTPGMIETAGISDVVGPVDIGGGVKRLTFKYWITLLDSIGRIAIGNAYPTVKIGGLSANWMTLKWQSGGPGDMAAPAFASGHANLTLEAGGVGRLPPALVAGTNYLRLSVDAHAQAVVEGASVSHLPTWYDLMAVNDLLGGPTTPTDYRPALTGGNAAVPKVDFHLVASNYFIDSTPPTITSPATIAAVIVRSASTGFPAHIVGRRDGLADIAWQVIYDENGSGDPQLVYKARSGTATYTAAAPLPADDQIPSFLVFRRKEDAGKTWQAWINGVLVSSGTFSLGVNTGNAPLSVGARSNGTGYLEPLTGQINQLALYDLDIDDLQLSLLMHQMADRAVVNLGTPLPSAWQVQPYVVSGGVAVPASRTLYRRPIAVVKLAGGQLDDNIFGQSPKWRNAGNQAAIVAALKAEILPAMYACDQFEIMFSKAGGQYSQDVVMSYIFGSKDGQSVVLADSWAAMSTLWTDLNLAADSDDHARNAAGYKQRRGWFYTGGGLPLTDNGALDTTGAMGRRFVAPATPAIYKSTILDEWSAKDSRFRCFFLDASSPWFGKLVELVHDSAVNAGFVLVGEAMPAFNTSDPADPAYLDQYHARLGAPWYANVEFGQAPWWNVDSGSPAQPDKDLGYNALWSNDWRTMPMYFGVQSGAYPDLFFTPGDVPGSGNNMSMGYIFKWVVKGGTPVSWNADTHAKVGAAWNYGTGRVMPSRLIRCPRLVRSIRC